jgi:hypothetical protein
VRSELSWMRAMRLNRASVSPSSRSACTNSFHRAAASTRRRKRRMPELSPPGAVLRPEGDREARKPGHVSARVLPRMWARALPVFSCARKGWSGAPAALAVAACDRRRLARRSRLRLSRRRQPVERGRGLTRQFCRNATKRSARQNALSSTRSPAYSGDARRKGERNRNCRCAPRLVATAATHAVPSLSRRLRPTREVPPRPPWSPRPL